jgi:hypothetical protein
MWNKIQNIQELKLAFKTNNDLLCSIAFNAGKYCGFSFYVDETGTVKYCEDNPLHE